MHIFQTDDPDGAGHYPRYDIPPYLVEEDLKVVDQEEVTIDYPDEQNLEEVWYLDTYTGKAYKGKRGLMVHLGQMAGQDNIPEDITDRHDADDFPIVDIDDDGNVTEVKKWPSSDVPALEPYLPWYNSTTKGYVPCDEIEEFIKEIEESPTGAASPEAIRRALLSGEV